MKTPIPQKWNSLNVHDFRSALSIGNKNSYPTNLYIKRQSNSPYLFADWLPPVDIDNRIRTSKKRRSISCSTGTDNPKEAAKIAIAWCIDYQKKLLAVRDAIAGKHPLTFYWEKYFPRELQTQEKTRGFKKWKREELRKWNAEFYGLAHQPFSKVPLDQITKQHWRDYFDLLERRANKSNNSNGSGSKAEMKTLINKLLEIASDDYSGHKFPDFPKISKQEKQVSHLRKDQWKTLVETVNELSGGAAKKSLTPEEYLNLDFKFNRYNQRNWVDLHDALLLQWFFFLRSEDMGRLRSEWFEETGVEVVTCNLQETKGHRKIHETTHFRPDAYTFWRRLNKRRPQGFLVAPHVSRQSENGVRNLLNHLLRHAIDESGIKFTGNKSWTTIRHTSFRLMLEDEPSLGKYPDITSFANNGRTKVPMLQKTYLNYISDKELASKVRRSVAPESYTLVKRIAT